MTRRSLAWLIVLVAVAGAGAGVARAFWASTDSANYAAASADTLPQGATPSATRTGATTVAVSFGRATTTRGSDVTSYVVNRYPSAGATTPSSTFTCSWASATTLACSETTVPGGTWYYTDTPAVAGSLWVGTASAKSSGVTTDLVAPTVSVASIVPTPNGAGYNNSTPVTVNLAATDNPAGAGGSGVASITYWVDAGTHTTVGGSAAGASVSGDGAHVVSFYATDNVGNVSATQTQNVSIDTAAPSPPSAPDLAAASDSGTSNTDNLTNVTTPTFTGTAEAGSTVTLFDGATQVGTGTGASYSITASALSSGAHSLTAKATDAAGNVSLASSALVVTIDTSAPSAPPAPVLAAASDSGTSNADRVTNVTTPTLTGTAETAATVTLFDGATQVGSGAATAGSYSIATSALSSGAHSITAKATDAAGNVSSTSSAVVVTIDTTAPVVGTAVIAKQTGYLAGSIKQGGTFYVYANITDATTITTATANISTLATGATAITLTAGSYSVEGVSYGYRSASQTANATLTAGASTYSITSGDVAGNSATQSSLPVTVDNTAPTASDIQTANAGVSGKFDSGDTIAFTYTEAIDPESILTGWTGASTNVVVRLVDGGCLLVLCGNDSFEIWNATNTARLPLTSSSAVDLGRADYNGAAILGLGTGADITAAATMVRSGSSITITLGTVTGSPNTAGGSGTMQWASTSAVYDAAGNLATATSKAEQGSADRDF